MLRGVAAASLLQLVLCYIVVSQRLTHLYIVVHLQDNDLNPPYLTGDLVSFEHYSQASISVK